MARIYRKKRRYTRRRKTAYGMAKKALNKVSKIKSAIEMKHYDLNIVGPNNLDWNPQLTNLNANIIQGIGDSGERIGDKIKLKGLRLKLGLDLNTVDAMLVRCIVMYDKYDKIDASTKFLSIEGNPNGINSPYDQDSRSQYTILHDKVYSLGVGYKREIQVNLSKKLNKSQHFEGGSTGVTKGIIRLWIFSNTSDFLVTKPQWYGYSRLYYVDM